MNTTINRYEFEKRLWDQGFESVMGLDEVGRGCLAGPVVAAGVILHPHTTLPKEVKDSKQLSQKDRNELAVIIKQKAKEWIIKEGSVSLIDTKNILKASLLTMLNCCESALNKPDYLLVDGHLFVKSLIPYSCIVKGDNRSISIAAASIIAKVYRDELMADFHKKYPWYGWDTNMGYPTKRHFSGLKTYGYTSLHRTSFNLRTDKIFVRD